MEAARERRFRHDIPKDALILTRNEAVQHQLKIIYKWKPWNDVWPLTFGRGILVGAAALTGFYINQRFRHKLKFRDYGVVPTMLSLTAAPSVVAFLLHSQYVQNKLLLLEVSCPLCLESKAALLQNFSALLFPLILTPFANFSVAVGSGVYNVPHYSDKRRMFKVISSVYQPMIPTIALIFTFHALLAGFITHLEMKSFLHIQDVLYLMEEDSKEQTHASKDLTLHT